MTLARQIELYLLDKGTWVSVAELCRRFEIRDRQLRADGDRDGLLDDFAVSSTRGREHGYMHVHCIEREDYLRAKRRLRKHSIRQLRKTKKWEQARARQRKGLPPHPVTLEGQILLLP